MKPLNTKRCSLNPFRQHIWGSWYNKDTGQYHSLSCERCGLWFGDFTRKYPSLQKQYDEQLGINLK